MAHQRAGAAAATRDIGPRVPNTKPPRIRRILDRLLLVVAGTALGLLLQSKVVGVVVVAGESMAPSLHPGDQLVIEKVTPRLGEVERGDIVVLQPSQVGELLVKRVVATEGDQVSAYAGRVYVNGQPLDENEYAVMSSRYFFEKRTIEPDQVFVLGDNRENSEDSAMWGPVSIHDIVGRCVSRPLPIPRHLRADQSDHVHAADGSDTAP